ncbi:MAG: rRNA maturation RNase YbeY [Syntrophomonadales bacterium]
MKTAIVNQQTACKWQKSNEPLIRKAINQVGKMCRLAAASEVNVVIVDTNDIREFNYVYRGMDQVTDVLSFAITETRDDEPDYESPETDYMLGDILICMERVLAQAQEYGHSPQRELVYLTVHGMLHLLGYDHEEENERVLMRSMEEKVMESLGLLR